MSPPPTPTPKFTLGQRVAALIEGEVTSLATRPNQPTLYTVAAVLADGTQRELRVEEFQLSSLSGGLAL